MFFYILAKADSMHLNFAEKRNSGSILWFLDMRCIFAISSFAFGKMRRIFFAFVLFSLAKSRSLTDILFPAEKAENNAKAIEQELDNSLVSVSKIRMQLIDTLKGSIAELNKVKIYLFNLFLAQTLVRIRENINKVLNFDSN